MHQTCGRGEGGTFYASVTATCAFARWGGGCTTHVGGVRVALLEHGEGCSMASNRFRNVFTTRDAQWGKSPMRRVGGMDLKNAP